MNDTDRFATRKRGNALAFWFFKASLATFGLRGAYGLLYFVCLHYLLFDRTAVRGAMAYISRLYPDGSAIKRYTHVYLLFVSQGKQLIDRYASLVGQVDFHFDTIGADVAMEVAGDPDKGLILLTSHVGNWQLAVSTLSNLKKNVYLVMLPEHNEALRRILRIRKNTEHINIISSTSHLGGAVEIMNALNGGHIVCMMGDRCYGFESLTAEFMGDKASFPYGAFQIAAAAQCPILFLFSAKIGLHKYEVDLSHSVRPAYKDRKNKRKELAGWIQEYADDLTEYIGKHPMQCFLFHDIWRKKTVD
jgi:predicted LPLAT superfamily acyltransferase